MRLLILAGVLGLPAAIGIHNPIIAAASVPNSGARIALHREVATSPTTGSEICGSLSPNSDELPCSAYSVTGPAPGASRIYVVAAQADEGVSWVSFGIDFNGRDPDGTPATGDEHGIMPAYVTWTQCANGLLLDKEGALGEWPAPQSAGRVEWNGCETTRIGGTVQAVVGCFYLYAYSEDVFRITPNNNVQSGPELVVAGCDNVPTNLLSIYPPDYYENLAGRVHLGGDGTQGFNPCATTPVLPASWGRLKARFTN